jgi:hypothetical protein
VSWGYKRACATFTGKFSVQNSFPMKEWHVEHMQKTVVKYVKGLPENASSFEKRNHKKYGGLNHICRQIEYDVKHGVTDKEVVLMLRKVRDDSSFLDLRNGNGSMQRLKEIETYFIKPRIGFSRP